MNESSPLKLAVIGAGPVGLALALHASEALPEAEVTLFDARPADKDVSADPRTLALSLGSVQLLERVGAWRPEAAQPIAEVHVSQQAPALAAALASRLGEPELMIRAGEEGVPLLGAVLGYGSIVAPLQDDWQAAVAREPRRLSSRFGTPVAAL
jgi:2-octaprenyl-6-methoxyphenol hydroxylase